MSWLPIELYKYGMIRFGRFKLTSGIDSPYYIDLRRLYSYPKLAKRVALEIIERFNVVREVDAIVGVATAGIPLATYIAALSEKPLAYIRSERKAHGMESLVEGDVAGRKTAIVDDVATTGGSIERAWNALTSAGSKPIAAIVIVDREQGARERLSRLGLKFFSLTTAREIFSELCKAGIIDESLLRELIEYMEKARP
ncbi:MAG: orotate phosphoribosyltransferase [Desulfurococcaceae archaeon]